MKSHWISFEARDGTSATHCWTATPKFPSIPHSLPHPPPACTMSPLRQHAPLMLVCLFALVATAAALKGVPRQSGKCPEQFPNEAICLGPKSEAANGCFAELAASCCGCVGGVCYGCPNSATCAGEVGEQCKQGLWSTRASAFPSSFHLGPCFALRLA